MYIEPKTAIAFRNKEECNVLIKVLKEQALNTNILEGSSTGRAYICPANYRSTHQGITLEWSNDPDCFDADEGDPFTWTYVEVADILRNLLIAERRKNAT